MWVVITTRTSAKGDTTCGRQPARILVSRPAHLKEVQQLSERGAMVDDDGRGDLTVAKRGPGGVLPREPPLRDQTLDVHEATDVAALALEDLGEKMTDGQMTKGPGC
jgi:hypothetical protein